jgi:hypothetical protein
MRSIRCIDSIPLRRGEARSYVFTSFDHSTSNRAVKRSWPSILIAVGLTAVLAADAPAQAAQTARRAPAFVAGSDAGRQAATDLRTMDWAARGVAGGIILGPIGTAIVVVRAGRAGIPLPTDDFALDTVDPLYLEGFSHGFGQAVRERRREAALVGGLIGTTVLTFAAIRMARLSGRQRVEAPEPPPPAVIRIPLPLQP